MLKGERFIVAHEGHMGLALWYVRPDLKLAVQLGCSVSVVSEELTRKALYG